MTVKQLMKKLAKLPPDAVVTITNTYAYLEGTYEVTEVEVFDFGDNSEVEISTNYKKRLEGSEEE